MSRLQPQALHRVLYMNKIMIVPPLVFFSLGLFVTSCSSGPEDKEGQQRQIPTHALGYETPRVLKAEEVLPPDLLNGKHHKVLEDVVTYGFTNHFTITSPYGQFEAEGEDILRTRIQEIQALAAMKELKKSNVFNQAVKNAASSPFRAAKGLILHPVDTISGVPKGAWEYMNRIDAGVNHRQEKPEESMAKELSEFSAVKRKFAYKFGVDAYSTNRVLQKELNSLSWAGVGGGIAVTLLKVPISDSANLVVKNTSFTQKMNELLRDKAPEELRQINEKLLEGMGVDQADRAAFLYHPWYSPRHQTILIHALAELEGVKNRDKYIKLAATAGFYEADAFLFQRMAEMMAGYHRHIGRIKELIPVRQRLIACYTVDETLVFVLPADFVHWTKQTSDGAKAVARLKSGDRPVSHLEVWLSGRFTPKAKQEIENLGVGTHENVYDKLMPPAKEAAKKWVGSLFFIFSGSFRSSAWPQGGFQI